MMQPDSPHPFIVHDAVAWTCQQCGRRWRYAGLLNQDNAEYLYQHAEDHRPLPRRPLPAIDDDEIPF